MSILKYPHTEIEAKWQKLWYDSKLYTLDLEHAKRPFYNLMMFPYPSAEGLHVGNMYAFTGADIYGRFMRMQGYDVFEPIGLDGFGIHSENFAFKAGKHPMDQVKKSEENFYRQLYSIGAMYDWSRSLETYDPEYYQWTQWLFVQMFRNGLAYRAKAEVNWCPSCKTVLADEQVIDEKCERCGNIVEKKALEQWFFKITAYAGKLLENIPSLKWTEKVLIAQRNWIGKKEGMIIHHKVEDINIQIDAFSAYPAWLWADTFMVIAPDHPLVIDLIKGTSKEKKVKDFIVKWRQSKKDTKKKTDEKEGIFTGRYAVDPFNKGARLPIWIANFALMGFGTGIIRCSSHDSRDFEFAKKYNISLKEVVVRTNSAEPVNAHTNEGVLQQSGPFSDKTISARLIDEIKDWIEQEHIGGREITYHLRDWLISRQRYWGPPIPMIYCKACEKNGKGEREDMAGWFTVADADLPIVLPRIDDYKPENDGIAPLAKHKEFYEVTCPSCGGKANRETDVSDTFLDSSWYFLRYPSLGSKTEKTNAFDPEIMKKWLPVSMYTGGAEHSVLHLMYSRFITMALKDWGCISFDEPFPHFYAHGLVIKDGAKMSKSKGNVVNPDEYIKLYGSDALRLYLMFMGPFSQGGDFRDSAMEGMSRWLNRVWRISTVSLKSSVKSVDSAEITKALHKLVKKVGTDTSTRHYNTAISAMMEFTNKFGTLSHQALRMFLLVLAPFAPHITEELWEKLGDTNSIHIATYPQYDETALLDDTVNVIIQVNGKLRDAPQVDVKTAGDVVKLEAVGRNSEKVRKYLDGKPIKKAIVVVNKLVNFVV